MKDFLSIVDRKKDLIKTSGGKFIAPQPIESALKVNMFVGEVALLGDRRRFPAVLIVPNFTVLEDWARGHGLHTDLTRRTDSLRKSARAVSGDCG